MSEPWYPDDRPWIENDVEAGCPVPPDTMVEVVRALRVFDAAWELAEWDS